MRFEAVEAGTEEEVFTEVEAMLQALGQEIAAQGTSLNKTPQLPETQRAARNGRRPGAISSLQPFAFGERAAERRLGGCSVVRSTSRVGMGPRPWAMASS